jgi:DeoR/GlpR family transcriptional regulator of sugar metabolism
MNGALRQKKIRDMLEAEEFVDMERLKSALEASESTIRRDLAGLENEGVLKRVYGGAMAMQTKDHALDFAWQSRHMAAEKKRIAALAAKLVEENQTIILDGGSTVAAVAHELTGRSLHIITNSLPIAEVFGDSRQIEITLAGGYLYPRLRATVGPLCEQVLSSVRADLLIMGIGGVTESGFSNSNTLIVGPELKMIQAARKLIIVTDHTKFGRGSVIHLAPLSEADLVVSDMALSQQYRDMLKAHNVEVLLA